MTFIMFCTMRKIRSRTAQWLRTSQITRPASWWMQSLGTSKKIGIWMHWKRATRRRRTITLNLNWLTWTNVCAWRAHSIIGSNDGSPALALNSIQFSSIQFIYKICAFLEETKCKQWLRQISSNKETEPKTRTPECIPRSKCDSKPTSKTEWIIRLQWWCHWWIVVCHYSKNSTAGAFWIDSLAWSLNIRLC